MLVIHLDHGVLVTLRDVMEDEYPTLLDVFLKDCEERIDTLHQLSGAGDAGLPSAAQSSPDLNALSMTAHSFKGSSSNMGALQLAELCRQLEELARIPPLASLSTIRELVEKIETESHTVRHLFEVERERFAARH